MPYLATTRLTIIPFTLDLLRAARRDPTLVGQRLQMHVPADWPGPDIAAALPAFIRQLEPDPTQDDWGVHLVGHTAERTLIGFAGCNNGPPDATGTVEIGYDVLPAYQRQGYATEATDAIIAWLFAQPRVQRVIADCDVDNIASRYVVERLGLRQQAPTDNRLNWALSREDWQALRATPRRG